MLDWQCGEVGPAALDKAIIAAVNDYNNAGPVSVIRGNRFLGVRDCAFGRNLFYILCGSNLRKWKVQRRTVAAGRHEE
jgi:hypothetical protein